MPVTYARFPLVAADRRTGEDRRVDVEHALSLPMPTRRQISPARIEANVAALMRLAHECANRHANAANWIGLEAAIRRALMKD